MYLDRSMVQDLKFHMQQGEVRERAGLVRNEPSMVKSLRSYNPHNQVVSKVSQRPYPLTIPYSQLIAHLKVKEYVRWTPKMKGNPTFHNKSKFCEFHNYHSHYTTDCRQLKVEITQLLK